MLYKARVSNSEKYKSIISTSLKIGIPVLALSELSHFSFPSWERRDVLERDTCCQLINCGNPKNLTVHHIIPIACSNGIHKDEISTGSEYVNIYLEIVRDFITSFSPAEQGKIRQSLKKVLDKEINGLTLCSYHHRQLHGVELDQSDLHLIPNENHLHRPKTLGVADTTRFLSEVILPLALENL